MSTITAYAAGATDKSVILTAYTASTGLPYTAGAHDTSGLALRYRRAGANAEVTITPATQTVNGAHSDGGFVHISGGRYRLDLPDAAVASGADYVSVWAYGITDVVFSSAHVDILGADPRAATVAPDAASIRSAVGLASANLDTQLSTIDTVVDDILADTAALDSRVPSDPADQSIIIAATDAILTAVGDVPTNAELATALGTADDAVLAAIADLDTVVDRVEADTQDIQSRLPSALVSGKMDSNTSRMNDTPIIGTGVSGDKFRGNPA